MAIKILDREVREKIAAGEVVQRPASVVKELVENSLDAGSDNIEVKIEDGGINYIEVSDNGRGMSREDLKLAVENHATSKIDTSGDLNRIHTMGFRGEALPSIGAVTKMCIITKTEGSDLAHKISVKGGQKSDIQTAARPEGTTVKIEDLFYNVPARKKYLKTVTTERRHISNAIKSLALSRPDVSFKLLSAGRISLDYVSSNLKERFVRIVGKKLYDKIIGINFENPFIKLNGFISRPDINYANKKKMYFLVNNRPVYSPVMLHALARGAREYFPPKRYPAAVLNIGVDPEVVDVNVHPAKKEVRFVNQQGIHKIIHKIVGKNLEKSSPVMDLDISEESSANGRTKKQRNYSNRNYGSKKGSAGVFKEGHRGRKLRDLNDIDLKKVTKFTFSGPDRETKTPREEGEIVPRFQWNNKYIVGEDSRGVVIIDQHTAAERVNYENLKDRFRNKEVNTQGNLFSEILELSSGEAELLSGNLDLLKQMGIAIEDFGPNSFKITGVPVFAGKIKESGELEEMIDEILDILGKMEDTGETPKLEDLNDEIIKIIACRSSVKAGDSLTYGEVESLVEKLNGCRVPHRCPHGRPVIFRITEKELDKKFDRPSK
ncbi:MAG: DNA mismatch repair endonuclease MutL [Elusimicrobiota bacterium]